MSNYNHDKQTITIQPAARFIGNMTEAPKQKVQCTLCACEGVDGTVLCRDHLDGFKYACSLLGSELHNSRLAGILLGVIKQKGSSNGKHGS